MAYLRLCRTYRVGVGVCALFALLPGCGAQTGSVSGRVTCQGRPVLFGQVALTPADGVPRLGLIQPDGTFLATGIPVGEALVTITSIDPAQVEENGLAASPKPDAPHSPGWFPIPARYADRGQSGLKLEVRPGHQEYDLPLK